MTFLSKPTKRPTTKVSYCVDWKGRKQDDYGSKYIVSLEKALEFAQAKKTNGNGYKISMQRLTTTNHVEDLDVKELLKG